MLRHDHSALVPQHGGYDPDYHHSRRPGCDTPGHRLRNLPVQGLRGIRVSQIAEYNPSSVK